MQNYENFTEKPKSREAQVLEDDDDQDDDNDFFGMNDYEPYAGYEGGEY